MYAPLTELIDTPHRAFQWWLRELAALAPDGLRRRLTMSAGRLVLYVSSTDIIVLRETADGVTSLGRLNAHDENAGDSLRALLRGSGIDETRANTCIRIDAAKAVRRQMQLPLAAEENLREVIEFELDRFTPFSPQDVYFATEVKERNVSNQQLKVEIVLVQRGVVDPAMIAAHATGLEPTRLDISGAPGSYAATPANLLPPDVGRRQGSTMLYLAAAAVVLALIAVYVPIERMQSTRDALVHKFSAAKTAATAANSLRTEIDDLRKQQTFLIDLKQERPMASKLLFEITHVLPDDAYLSAWSLAGSEVQIEGTAKSASAVVGLLEQSHLFQNTTFRSPVVQAPGAAGERFRIATKVADGDPQ